MVIDYGLATVMLPTVLMGSMVGVMFNVMMPSTYLKSILVILLIILAIQSGIKAYYVYQKESEEMNDSDLISYRS